MRILILGTGGTIDDLEYSDEKEAPKDRSSIIPDLLSMLNLQEVETSFEQLMLKDSEFIHDADREIIFQKIESTDIDKIVITHGTKTMSETAKYLGKLLNDKTILLTGSMTLPSKDNSKDAIGSLRFALQEILSLPYGVFVAMQGKIFNWDNVRKNIEQGIFEEEI